MSTVLNSRSADRRSICPFNFCPFNFLSQAGGSRLLSAFSSLLCAPSLNLYGTLAL